MDRYQKVEKPRPEAPINENEIRITAQGLVRNYISYATSLLQERRGKEIVFKAMGQAISKTVAIAEIIKRRIPQLHQDTAISSVSITDVWEPLEEGLLPVEQTRQVSMISITLSPREINKNSPGYQAPSNVEQPRPQRNYRQQQQPRQQYNNYQQQQPRQQFNNYQQPQQRQQYNNYQQQQSPQHNNYQQQQSGPQHNNYQQQQSRPQHNNYQQQQSRPQHNNYQQQQQQQPPRQARGHYNAVNDDEYAQGDTYGQGRGRGRGRGRGWSRGGYGNYHENGGYSNWGRGGGRGRGWEDREYGNYQGAGYERGDVGYERGDAGYERGRGGGGRGNGRGRGRGRMGGRPRGDDY